MRRDARGLVLAGTAALMTALPLGATSETIDYEAIARIKQQGLVAQNSKVMEISSWLTDVLGPRLTGSPNTQKAGEWTVAKMKEWGLQNVALEPWTYRSRIPRGWTNDKFYMAAISPQAFPIAGTPAAWTPGTVGLARGDVMLVTETSQEDLAKYKGKLRGKWILTQTAPDVPALWTAPATRRTIEELERLALVTQPAAEFGVIPPVAGLSGRFGGPRGSSTAAAARMEFFRAEGALGALSTTARGHGIYLTSGRAESDPDKTLPSIVIPAEHYGRMARILANGLPVTLEAEIKNTFHPNPALFNVVGEIRGTDKADEIVMLGAHFDSWHGSTGATDNAAGSAAMLEAMRILKQSGVTLRRTVRIGLWTGEEQGLIGSAQYVAAHFASRAAVATPAGPGPASQPGQASAGGRGGVQGPLETKPDYAKFAGYFNLDNGTGAIRGVYLQGNEAVAPIFREWMEPFRSLGMAYLTIRSTGGTDHQSFDRVGLPGFQFIQDDVEYNSVTHHTNLDSYERLQPNDMMKNATIAAAFAYLTANRDDKLPRRRISNP
jgi:carboxypeptidase Q